MDLVGVIHDDEYVEATDRYLLNTYPDGIDSLMLELHPSDSAAWYDTHFFRLLAHRWEKRGSHIIRGDVYRDNSEFSPYTSQRFIARIKNIFTNIRDEGMAEVASKEKPKVAVLGVSHTSYLKRRFPDARYTYLEPEDAGLVEKLIRRPPRNADEIVKVQKLPIEPPAPYKNYGLKHMGLAIRN